MHINEILSGFDHTVAITEEGECYAWGDGADGKLGTGNTQQQWNPVKVHELYSREYNLYRFILILNEFQSDL